MTSTNLNYKNESYKYIPIYVLIYTLQKFIYCIVCIVPNFKRCTHFGLFTFGYKKNLMDERLAVLLQKLNMSEGVKICTFPEFVLDYLLGFKHFEDKEILKMN